MIRFACIALLLASPIASIAQTLAVRGGDGAVLGFYTGPGATTGGQFGYFRVISSSGYAAAYNALLGTMPTVEVPPAADGGGGGDRVLFVSSDCSGQGYVNANADVSRLALGTFAPPGFVFRSGTTVHELWYVAKDAVAVAAGVLGPQIQRARYDGACIPASPLGTDNLVYPVAPNDPGITGFPNAPAVPPLTIEPVPVSAVFSIFRDSFESPQASIAREGMIDAALAESRYS